MIKKPRASKTYLENVNEPLFTLSENELREILDVNWYPAAREAVMNQRKIWDYSYLAYKGIMTAAEINRNRRADQLGIYVNVPRTLMTVEGIRRNFNISKLRVALAPLPGVEEDRRNNLSSFLNYDLVRGKAHNQIKDAGFYKLLYGNGFLYNHLCERKGYYGKITGDIDPKTAIVKNVLDKKETRKYFGMVTRAVSPYEVFPDPDGNTTDYNDSSNTPCQYHCIRRVKSMARFKRDWCGIVPKEILDNIIPGGHDMENYQYVKDQIDYLFSTDALKYPGTAEEYYRASKTVRTYNKNEYVEERLWLGEDFFILQAGADLKFCIISPNPNPAKILPLVKLDDVRIPGEYWAMGEPYIMRYQQIEENRAHNAVLDSVMHSIAGMIGINKSYLEDQNDLEIYPQKVWALKTMPGVKIDEAIQSFSTSSSGIAGGIKFLDEIKNIGQGATSITDFVTGASQSIAGSATETNRLSGASDLAIMDKVKEISGEALSEVAKIFLSMYPVAYSDEIMSTIFEKNNIFFFGKNRADVSEEELADALMKYEEDELIFLDDLDIAEPTFNVVGEVSLDREKILSQWISAIDYAKKINEVAYATGDPRRIDIIKMGILGLENFDVIGDPEEFLMEEQPVKTDEIALNAEMNMKANQQSQMVKMQQQNGGAPTKNKITTPETRGGAMRRNAQPTNANKNKLSNKNR